MNVAIYARVSTKDKGQDTENQVAQLRAFAATQNWKISAEYIDHASGKTSDRDQFQQLFADASKRLFDAVLFWSLDRFSREGALETLKLLDRLTSYGVRWRSYTEQYIDSCGIFRDAILSILATIAKQERIRLSERTVAGLQRAKAQGRKGGRPVRIFDRRKALDMKQSGMSLREIGAELGVPWSTVRRALSV